MIILSECIICTVYSSKFYRNKIGDLNSAEIANLFPHELNEQKFFPRHCLKTLRKYWTSVDDSIRSSHLPYINPDDVCVELQGEYRENVSLWFSASYLLPSLPFHPVLPPPLPSPPVLPSPLSPSLPSPFPSSSLSSLSSPSLPFPPPGVGADQVHLGGHEGPR